MSDLKAKFLYTTVDSVKVRLAGKVQFQEDCNSLQNGELPDLLLLQLIRDAETETEQDLRSRYSVPFRSIRSILRSTRSLAKSFTKSRRSQSGSIYPRHRLWSWNPYQRKDLFRGC
jgi:phage gp36-like protein